MSMMRKLLESMTKFAGEPEQKPGEQWKGTDKGTPGTKLVGGTDESVLKDLSKGVTPKTKEEELAEAYANFMEDDIGVEPKRPGRKSDRPHREYTKHGKPSKRYTTVEDTELNEYKKDADNFTADDIKELEGIKDLATLKARAFALISKPSARPMKPEKVAWFKNRLDSLVSPIAVIKLMYDLLLSGEGQRVIGSRSSMGSNSYRSRFNEGWNTGNNRVSLPDSPHTYWSGTGPLQKEYDALYNELVPSQGKADTIEGEVLRASSKIVYRHYNDGDEFNEASFDQLTPYIGTVTSYDDLAHKAIEFALKANGNYTPNPDWDSLDVMDYGPAEEEEYDDDEDDYGDDGWPDDEEVDEGRGDSKGLHKKVTIVKGRDAGKTGYVRQIKTDKLRNRVYLDLDLEDGGQAVVLKQDVRLVKEVDEARTTWNNDFYVYDPKTKTVKKKFRTHKGAKQYAEANGLKVASAEYYHDSISKEVDEGIDTAAKEADYNTGHRKGVQDAKIGVNRESECISVAEKQGYRNGFKGVAEGWESGPEERTRVERDPDAEYDARRQEKLDAPYAQKEPEAKGYLVVSLDTRQPVTDEVFPTKGHAMAYIQSNHSKNLAYRAINEGIESGDPVESAVLSAVQELIQQGHTEVAPEVITNMVVAATSQPFLLKDLVDCNNNSPAIQHYVDSINPTKVKFSNEILTVKNEDPLKDKKQAQAGVSSMAARAASRNRLGEGSETPLRDTEDYQAKRSALQQIQLDPDTHKDPQLKAELARRLGSLNQQYSDLQSKLREFKESRGHKVIATKLGNMDRMNTVQIPTPAERQEQIRLRKEKETVKKPVKEFAAPGANPATPVTAAKPAVDPAAVAKAAAATNTLKAATGTTVASATLDKALDSATQGTATSTDVKALAPIMGVLNKAAADPKLASQFKTIANQAKLTP